MQTTQRGGTPNRLLLKRLPPRYPPQTAYDIFQYKCLLYPKNRSCSHFSTFLSIMSSLSGAIYGNFFRAVFVVHISAVFIRFILCFRRFPKFRKPVRSYRPGCVRRFCAAQSVAVPPPFPEDFPDADRPEWCVNRCSCYPLPTRP